MLYVLLGLLAILPIIIMLGNTRVAQLKHLARTLNLRYQSYIDNPLTPLSGKNAYFFNQGFHQFRYVLTWEDPGAFMRVCEDYIYASPMDKIPQQNVTLITAELTKETFIPLIITLRQDDKSPAHPALPAELANRYTLTAPANYQLSPELVSLLKNNTVCYLETVRYALIYHEYRTIPVDQIQQTRFRVKQFIKELVEPSDPVVSENVTQQTLSPAEWEANILLTLQNQPRKETSPNRGLHIGYIVLTFLLLIGILFISQYYLRQFVH